ncbi:uncharacterized protein LOC144094646 [Amblyomma americanum]
MVPPDISRRAFFLPLVALTELAALARSSSPLEDALKGTVPLYQLNNHQGAVSSNQSSSYTCFAVTRMPTSLRWEVNGSQALDKEYFITYYSQLGSISSKSKNIFARYSTLTMKKTTKSQVRCVVEVHDANRSPGSTIVKLSTVSTVSGSDQGFLHVTYGQPCRRRSHGCATEHASCSTQMSDSPICLCETGYRYVNTSGLCMALQAHMSACLLDYPCALAADRCNDGRCNCREGFLADSSGCQANVTLNSGCDEHRLCPEGAHCVNNICTCRPGYVPWGYGCLRKFLSGDGMRRVHSVIRFLLTAVFTVAMVVLGVWLYHHSHSPSLMRERSVANWEYMPKMDQS